jgi:hypothetical protein
MPHQCSDLKSLMRLSRRIQIGMVMGEDRGGKSLGVAGQSA